MSRLFPRARWLALLLSTTLFQQSAFAQSSAPGTAKAAAETLFEEARNLMQQQRYAEACAKFEASQALDSGIGTLLHLADCYEKAGRTASAWATFKEAASMSRLHAQDDRERIALTRASALEQRLSRLTIHVPEAHRVSGLEIKLQGNRIPQPSWETPIPVDPGGLEVEASAPGRNTWTTHVDIASSAQDNRVEVPLLEMQATTPAVTAEPNAATGETALTPTRGDTASSGDTRRTLAYVVGGAGIVGLGLGATFGVLAKKKNDDSLDYCPRANNLCTARGVELRDDAKSYATASTIAVAAGGGLLVTGLVLLLTAPSKPERAATRLNFAFDVQPRAGSVHMGGTF